ncbi:hypothetical protein [Streptomyces tauricus]|uniref:hypothetical protein n=1 Tax=Streptomyces tauricus TaxID=68274 RepID=UPI0037F47102
MDAVDVLDELFVELSPGGLRASAVGIVCRDREVQFPAYGLDPEVVAEMIDHRVSLVRGWSSSFAKNTKAAFEDLGGPAQLGYPLGELAQLEPLGGGQQIRPVPPLSASAWRTQPRRASL